MNKFEARMLIKLSTTILTLISKLGRVDLQFPIKRDLKIFEEESVI